MNPAIVIFALFRKVFAVPTSANMGNMFYHVFFSFFPFI